MPVIDKMNRSHLRRTVAYVKPAHYGRAARAGERGCSFLASGTPLQSGREATFESVPSTGYEIVENFPSARRGVRHFMISELTRRLSHSRHRANINTKTVAKIGPRPIERKTAELPLPKPIEGGEYERS
jgi:hypothetical protein